VFALNPAVVVTVSVDGWSAPVLVTAAGEKVKNPPGGGAGQLGVPVGAALNVTVQLALLPPNTTVSGNVA